MPPVRFNLPQPVKKEVSLLAELNIDWRACYCSQSSGSGIDCTFFRKSTKARRGADIKRLESRARDLQIRATTPEAQAAVHRRKAGLQPVFKDGDNALTLFCQLNCA